MTSSYGWLITHDSIADSDYEAPSNNNARGMYGPHDIGPDQHATLERVAKAGFKHYYGKSVRRFQIRDDDGELYYTGLYIGPDDEDMFGPLEDFGTPNAGATEILYFNRETGEYEAL